MFKQQSYILTQDTGLRKLLHKLFVTTKQPYKPRLKVLCYFYCEDNSVFSKMMRVDYPKWHFEPIIINGIPTGEKLIIDGGYITLENKRERYFVVGTPPFTYLFNDAEPCPTWMAKMLEEGARGRGRRKR